LASFLTYIDTPLLVLQTPEALTRSARELVEDWAADGVAYGEVRFAPQLHTRQGMDLDEAIRAVAAGLGQGRAATGVQTGLILCALRHQTPDESAAVAEAAVRNRHLVCGLDLAGDERAYSGEPHREAFEIVHAAGLRRTVHAGEAAGAASMWEALDVLGAERIGHGVRCIEDGALVQRLRTDRIALEMCPTSNVQTTAVTSLASHPAIPLLGQGVAITISTDTRTTSATTLEREFRSLGMTNGWRHHFEGLAQRHAREAAFGLVAEPDAST
jgi:adenosine deaminase